MTQFEETAAAANKLLQPDGSTTLLDGTVVDMTTAVDKYKQMAPMANKFLNPNGDIIQDPRGGSSSSDGVSKTAEIIINSTDDEVAGKQYQSIANANTYLESLPITTDTPQSIGISGVVSGDIEKIDYASIFGDGMETSKLSGTVTLENGLDNAVDNSFYNLTLATLSMVDVESGAGLITTTISQLSNYDPFVYMVMMGVEPTSGTFSITVNGTVLVFNWDDTSDVIQTAIRAVSPLYSDFEVEGDIGGGFMIRQVGYRADTGVGITAQDINLDPPATEIFVEETPGINGSQTISFGKVPTSGQWMLKYLYNGNYYYTGVLAYNADNTVIQTAIRGIFTDINTAESIDLGATELLVTGDYTNGFVVDLVGYPGTATLFELENGPITISAGTYASFTGQVSGMTTDVTVTADTIGIVGDGISLPLDGILTIQEAITSWNLSNPTNTCSLTSGDGTQIPDHKTGIITENGEDPVIYNYSLDGTALIGQKVNLDNVKITNFNYPSSAGTKGELIAKNCIFDGGDTTGLTTSEIYDSIINAGSINNGTIYGGTINLSNTTISGGGLSMFGTHLTGSTSLDSGTLDLKNTIGGTITIEGGATLNTYGCANLTVINNGGTWNNYDFSLEGYHYFQDNVNPVTNDYRIFSNGIYLDFERYDGSVWVQQYRIGASAYIPRYLEITKDANADLLVKDGTEIRNLIRSASFSDGTVVGDISGDIFLTTEDKLFKAKPTEVLSWKVLQSDYTKTSVGTSFYLDNTTRNNDGFISRQIKLKFATATTQTKAQVKIYLQSDLVNPIRKNMTEAELNCDCVDNLDPTTGILSFEPKFYGIGNKDIRVVVKFIEEVELLGSTTDGTDIYLESNDRTVSFTELGVFGTEFEQFESIAESSAGTSFTNKIDATTAEKPIGKYRVGFSCEVTGDYQEITFMVDGCVIHNHTTGNDELEPEVSSTSNWTTLSGIHYLTLTSAATIDLNIQHKDSGSGKMSNANIEIRRVA